MKIVILDGYTLSPGDIPWDGFETIAQVTRYDNTLPDEAAARIGDAELVLTNKVPITRAVLDACPNVRYIGVLATGYNVVDLEAAAARNICVTNVPAYGTMAVAQLVFALLLEICHHVGAHSKAVHDGEWTRRNTFTFWNFPLIELDGKTLGIVGLGAIGRQVARIAEAMGMRVIAADPVSTDSRVLPLDDVLAQADVLTLHCPLTAENTGMINRDTITKMKDGAILINTARGPLLNEADIRDALTSGKLAAASVDVVSTEPIQPDNPLLSAPNCFITPHIAWAPLAARRRLMDIAVENLRAFLDGRPQNRVQ